MRLAGWVLLLPLLAGCLDFDEAWEDVARRLDGGAADAGVSDGGAVDAGDADAGATDGGGADGGDPDAGASDAGTPDAGTPDAGDADGGVSDGGATDAGLSDAGLADAGAPDAGGSDAGLVDGGATDAGPRCGPARLELRQLFVEDGGIVTYLAASVSDAGVLLIGEVRGADSTARALPSLTLSLLPTTVVAGSSQTPDELFTVDFSGGGVFRVDAGYSSVLTGPCTADFAGAVYSPRAGHAVFCDEGTFAACSSALGVPTRVAPGLAIPGQLSCSAVALTADGGLLRGGAVRPDAGNGNPSPILLGVDGGFIALPAGITTVTALVATEAEAPVILNEYGHVSARRDGGWVTPANDGGGFRVMAPVTPGTVFLAGPRGRLGFFDGAQRCEPVIEGLPAGFPEVGWAAVAQAGTRLVLGGSFGQPDAGGVRAIALLVELRPW